MSLDSKLSSRFLLNSMNPIHYWISIFQGLITPKVQILNANPLSFDFLVSSIQPTDAAL